MQDLSLKYYCASKVKDMEIKIRKATIQDCTALCEIHVSSIQELTKDHHTAEEIEVWLSGRTPERYEKHISERQVIIAQDMSLPVGFGTFDLATGELIQLYVRPEYAGKGVGKQILEELINMARASGIREIHLLSSLNAEAFYAKAGFQPGQKSKHLLNGGEIYCIPMKKLLE